MENEQKFKSKYMLSASENQNLVCAFNRNEMEYFPGDMVSASENQNLVCVNGTITEYFPEHVLSDSENGNSNLWTPLLWLY